MVIKGKAINPDCPYCKTRLKRGKMGNWKCKGCNRFIQDKDLDTYIKSDEEILDEWRSKHQ